MTDSDAGATMVSELSNKLRDIADRSVADDRHVLLNAVHTLQACERLLSKSGMIRRAAA